MGAQVVYDHERHTPAGARPGDGSPDLGAKDIGRTAWGQSAVKPARTPIDEAKAINLVVSARGLDQPLPAPAFPAPDPREGRMKRKLDLILEIEIGVRQEGPQFFQVWRHCLQEIGIHKSGNGWRRRRAGPGQDYLYPQTFPTSPGCASALRLSVQVGRWRTPPAARRYKRTVSAVTATWVLVARYVANKRVVQLALRTPTVCGSRSITRRSSACHSGVTVGARPGAVRGGRVASPPCRKRLSTRSTVSRLRKTMAAISATQRP